jgi:hypothetical protein
MHKWFSSTVVPPIPGCSRILNLGVPTTYYKNKVSKKHCKNEKGVPSGHQRFIHLMSRRPKIEADM